jgi:protein SCO1/2
VPTRVALALTTLVICAAAGVFGVWLAQAGGESGVPAGWQGSLRPPGARMPGFTLTDQDGRTVTAQSLHGQTVVFAFVYSTCKDICPAQVRSIRGALDRLGHDVPVVGVSVDPANDTPDRAKTFLIDQAMRGRMEFLLGSRAQLEPVWKAFGIAPQSKGRDHSSYTVIVDATGHQRIAFPSDQLTPSRLAADLAKL